MLKTPMDGHELGFPVDNLFIEIDTVLKMPQKIHAEQSFIPERRSFMLDNADDGIFQFEGAHLDVA